MSDVPNRPEPPPPPILGNSARMIHTVPDDTKCEACDLPVTQGQSVVETDLGHILHSFCWELSR